MDPVLDLAKAYVLEQFQAVAAAGAEDAEGIIEGVAQLILGPHEEVLAEYAAKAREQVALQHAQAAVQKRAMEEQCTTGLATIDAALAALNANASPG